MKKRILYRSVIVVAIALGVVLVNGCVSVSQPNYVNDYKLAKDQSSSSAAKFADSGLDSASVAESFSVVMQNLKAEDLQTRITQAYASDLYFNDTLHTFRDSQSLTTYLLRTGQRLHAIDVIIDDVVLGDMDAYIRWTMNYQTDPDVDAISSVGITHLRFNIDGKIVLHQDYWDSVEGFYRSIPGVGFVLNQVRKRL